MKKNLWFVFVALSMMAIFLVAGCKPTTPETSPSPSPTATPTVAPDTDYPRVVSTVASKAYDAANGDYNFKVVITFDEPVELSACAENPSNWNVTVKNRERIDNEIDADVVDVSVDGKKVILKAYVSEPVSGSVYVIGVGYVNYEGTFKGLICSEDDADRYGKLDNVSPYGDLGAVDPPTVADEVKWSLNDCFIFDELGNGSCSYSGSDCCLEPVCEECVEGCPLGGGICP
ncbi:MAG: hypothetical protein ACUVQZ_06890 [Candidatus Caldatribacteriaceae bacterium]